MSVNSKNKTFTKVYNKTKSLLEKKIKEYCNKRKYGGKIPKTEVKTLLLYITYLDKVNSSKYDYTYIKGLTDISNQLNNK